MRHLPVDEDTLIMKKQRTPKNGQEAQESGGSEVFHSWQGVLENSKVAAHIGYPALAASRSAALGRGALANVSS